MGINEIYSFPRDKFWNLNSIRLKRLLPELKLTLCDIQFNTILNWIGRKVQCTLYSISNKSQFFFVEWILMFRISICLHVVFNDFLYVYIISNIAFYLISRWIWSKNFLYIKLIVYSLLSIKLTLFIKNEFILFNFENISWK